jgi:hypothetical protein
MPIVVTAATAVISLTMTITPPLCSYLSIPPYLFIPSHLCTYLFIYPEEIMQCRIDSNMLVLVLVLMVVVGSTMMVDSDT